MKKIFFSLSIVFGLMPHAWACDGCGSGSGNYYLGIMPQFSQHFVGFRYRNASFRSGIGGNKLYASQDRFQTTELWARFYPHPRVQVMAFVPYQFNQHTSASQSYNRQGVGDIVLLTNYRLINTSLSALPRAVNHTVLVGGGIKLPTGQFHADDPNASIPNVQFGTGSTDFLASAMYTLRIKRLGLSMDATYKINTRNTDNYQYGNRSSGTASVFFVQKLGENIAFMPNTGIYAESSHTDQMGKYKVDKSGGTLSAWNVGMETYWFQKISVGMTYQTIIGQHLSGGSVEANKRFVAHVSMMF